MCTSAARRERDQQPAVLVVGGEEVGGDPLLLTAARTQTKAFAEPADAPFERQLGRIPLRLETAEPEPLDDVRAEELLLGIPGDLEDAPPGGENPRIGVADDEAGVRRRVV